MPSALAGFLAAAVLLTGCSAATGAGAGAADTTSEPWRTAALLEENLP